MNGHEKNANNDPNTALDRIVDEIRDETIAAPAIASAAGRVWDRLTGESAAVAGEPLPAEYIHECAGFQALVPDYLAQRLASARLLLFEDHVRDCVTCHRTLEVARNAAPAGHQKVTAFPFAAPRKQNPVVRWSLAAAAVAAAALVGLGLWNQLQPGTQTRSAQIQSVDGVLYKIADQASLPVAAGQNVGFGDPIRTAKDSRAVVQLADGSLIEMRERSEISLAERASETTIRLARGSVIVQAAKQRSGHLYVATDDCLVSVVGTIFSVNRGSKGSRVSVIEGEVHVAQGTDKKVLLPGQQLATDPSVTSISVQDEIAWSHDVDRYNAVLSELKSLGRDIDRSISPPSLHHATRLLDSVPEGTIVYASIPNISGNLAQAHDLLKQRIAESAVLHDWWDENMGRHGADPEIDRTIEEIRSFGAELGPEIVLAVQANEQGTFDGLLLISELKNPGSFRSVLDGAIAKARPHAGGNHPAFRIITDPAGEPAAARGPMEGKPLLLWIHDDLFMVSSDASLMREAAASPATSGKLGFSATPFHARLAAAYGEGAGWLFGIDLHRIMAKATSAGADTGDGAHKEELLRQTGLLDAQDLLVESKPQGGKTINRGTISFDKPRQGLASWLAAPAPMGVLDFISPDASVAAAFVVKNPALMVDDVYRMLEVTDPNFRDRLTKFESEQGINVRDDIAATLGGEVAFAVDGPLLPVPSWKLVLEVYDPVRLQRTVDLLVEKANQSRPEGMEGTLTIEHEVSGTRTFHTLRCSSSTVAVHYVLEDGYLIAAPSRGLLESAIQGRASGQVLTSAPRFRALLPQDGEVNFSALAYENLGDALSPLAKQFGGGPGTPTTGESGAAGVLAAAGNLPAKLIYAYGEEDRIVIASSAEGGFGSDLASLFGIAGFSRLHEMIEKGSRQHGAPHPHRD